jgi:hypothetical protein
MGASKNARMTSRNKKPLVDPHQKFIHLPTENEQRQFQHFGLIQGI